MVYSMGLSLGQPQPHCLPSRWLKLEMGCAMVGFDTFRVRQGGVNQNSFNLVVLAAKILIVSCNLRFIMHQLKFYCNGGHMSDF